METNEFWFVLKCYLKTMGFQIIYSMYKDELISNNLEWLIWHKTKPIQIKPTY